MRIKGKSLKQLAHSIGRRVSLSRLEWILARNWYNPLATVWVNWRCFPAGQAWRLPMAVYGRPRFFELGGTMEIADGVKVRRSMIRFNESGAASPGYSGCQSQLCIRGKVVFRGPGMIGSGCKIIVERRAILDLGSSFKITDGVNIACSRSIKIGNVTRIVHRCQVMDTNFHYLVNFAKGGMVAPVLRKIEIGNNCWICNSTTVTGGAVIPDLTIVGSNSLVNRDFSSLPPESLIGGCPAKHLATGFRRIDNKQVESELNSHFREHPDEPFFLPSDIDHSILSDQK